jgi:hypothetical protein
MSNPDNPEAWQALSALIRSLEPTFERELLYFQSYSLDQTHNPATHAIVSAYTQRLEMALNYSRRGTHGLQEQAKKHPNLLVEIMAIMRWLKVRKSDGQRGGMTEQDADMIGDWLVKFVEPSYSKARRFIDEIARSVTRKGAPSKRPETLMMLDARLVNGWSYATLASKMCDCGGKEHGEYCRERIRKRIKELELFMREIGIAYKPHTPGEK